MPTIINWCACANRDKNVATNSLKLKQGEVDFEIFFEGNELELKDIRTADVLSVAKSKDGSFVHIDVSRNRVAGSVSGFTDGKCSINDVDYEFSNRFSRDFLSQC